MQRSNAILSVMLLTIAAAGCQNLPAQKVNVRSASQTAATADQEAAVPPGPGHVNVNVVCGDVGKATSVTIAPWSVKPDSQRVTWRANGPKEMQSFEVRAANTQHWPFPQPSYDSRGSGEIVATLSAEVPADTYHYVLRIVCPNKVITIDPDIMVSRKR